MNIGTSIIVLTFNRADMLKDSLLSLKSKTTHNPKEIILVDGGSRPEHIAKYDQLKNDGLYDRAVMIPPRDHIPYHEQMDCIARALVVGLDACNPELPYVHFSADDLLYRTGWTQVLIDMIESEWAYKHNVKVVSGFNTWCQYDDYEGMKKYVPELYKSIDGLVEGYCAWWGGNYFMRKKDFHDMGGFTNNLKHTVLPNHLKNNFEEIMQKRFIENNWHWGTTRETYVQTMARPGSSILGNYARDAQGNPLNDWNHKHGIAVGVAWKDV